MAPWLPAVSLLLLCVLYVVPALSARHPVVMVPGLAGSVFSMKLDGGPAPHITCSKKSDWFIAWVSVEEMVPIAVDCLLARLAFTFDSSSGDYKNAPGVSINSSVDFGGVGGIAYLDPSLKKPDYFHSLTQHLVDKLGYTVGTDLHGAPYDWRWGPDGHNMTGAFYARLKTLVETTYERNGRLRVHLVSHSLGGPTLLAWLNMQTKDWRDKYIETFIPIAPPFAGSTEQILASISGDNFGIPLVPSDYLYPVQAAAPSGVFLWPVSKAFGSKPIVFTPSANYTAADLLTMNTVLNNTQAIDAYHNLHSRGFATVDAKPPEVSTYVVYSKGLQTANQFHYSRDFSPSFDHSAPASREYGDGDGTVNLESVQWAMDTWKQQAHLSFFLVPKTSHFGLMSDPRVLGYVASVIANHSAI